MRTPPVSLGFSTALLAVAVLATVYAGITRKDEPAAAPTTDVVSTIWSAPVAGGKPRLLLRDAGHQDAFPAWRRDGSILVTRATSLGETALVSLRRDGRVRELRRLPVFSPLQYSAKRDALALTRGTKLVAETPTGKRLGVLALVPRSSVVAWSADGRSVAFPGTRDVVVVRDSARRAYPVPGAPSGLALSPSGDRILFESARRLLLLDTSSGSSRVVAPRGFGASWSPDGRTIAFSDDRGVVFLDLVTNRRTRGPAHAALVSFAPDGRSVVYARVNDAQSIPK